MAKKSYTWPNGVLVNDVKVVFEEAPTTGDVFTIKPNEGAIGDNGNITHHSPCKRLALMETRFLLSATFR